MAATESQLARLNKDVLTDLADDHGVDVKDKTKKQIAKELAEIGVELPGKSEEDETPVEEEVSSDEEAVEIIAGDASEYRELAARTSDNIRDIRERDNDLFVELAAELNVVRQHNLYLYINNPHTGQPYRSMKDYLLTEVDYSERKAHYLSQIFDKFQTELQILNEVKDVGWSKLKEVVDVVTKSNWEEWYQLALELSTKELKAKVKEEKIKLGLIAAPSPEDLKTEQTKRVTFALFPDQESTVNKALDTAREMTESDNKSELISLICTDFLAGNANASGDSTYDILSRLENTLGIRIAAFQNKQIVFGAEFIQSISSKSKAESAPATTEEAQAEDEPEVDSDEDLF